MKTLAIDIGGTKFTVGAFDGNRLIHRASRSTDRNGGPSTMVPQIGAIINDWRVEHSFRPERCGIGFGGPVDFESQTVTMSTHVGGWSNFPLVQAISEMADASTKVSTRMDNDANVGALGESVYGAGQDVASSFYMTLSTGIGGGFCLNGSLWRGADSFAGEIGHINIDPAGPACLCGSQGCFERMCCGLWLERDFGQPASELLLDPAFVQKYVVLLARGLKAAIMILNPHVVIIGGGLSKAGDRLFVPLREELSRQITSWSKARRAVVPAALEDNSVLYGALVLAHL